MHLMLEVRQFLMGLHHGAAQGFIDLASALAGISGAVAQLFKGINALHHAGLIMRLHHLLGLPGLLIHLLDAAFHIHWHSCCPFAGLRSLMDGLFDVVEALLKFFLLHHDDSPLDVAPERSRKGWIRTK